MAEYNDILIFGVRSNAQTPDTGFIVTPDEFGQMLSDAPDALLDEIRAARESFGDSVWTGFDKTGASYSVRMVKMVEDISKDTSAAAAYMAKSIRSYGEALFAFPSQAAREELSKLLSRMLQVSIPSRYSAWQAEKQANSAAWDHVKDVQAIFSACGLLHAERSRSSVTQGEALIIVGRNQTAVRYADNIYLPTSGELMRMGFSPSEIEAAYGPIIGGWISKYSNEYLVQQALLRYPEEIKDALRSPELLPPKTASSLDIRISEARSRTNTAEQVSSNDLSR